MEEKKLIHIKVKRVLICVILLIILIFFWQVSVVSSVKNFYENKQYQEAKVKSKSVLFDYTLGDLLKKVEILGTIDYYWNNALKYKNSESSFVDLYEKYCIRTLSSCIGYYEEAIEFECIWQVNSIRKKSAQELANSGVDVLTALKEIYNSENGNIEFYPLSLSNYDKVGELIEKIVKDFSQVEVDKIIKENQSKNNPLEIIEYNTYKDGGYWYCTGTVSNLSNKEYNFVEVRVTYYDENNSVLTTDWIYAVDSKGIRAEENQQFEIMTKVNGDPSKYKVEIQNYQE